MLQVRTQGPWSFESYNGTTYSGRDPSGCPYAWVNLNGRGSMGAIRFHGHAGMSDAETRGNAYLIAAAPDLLDASLRALQLIRDNWPEDHGCEQVGRAWGALENAIEKATRGVAVDAEVAS